jgi:hypothetical protein
MHIRYVTPEARKYIMDKGGHVTLRMIRGQGGCCSMLSPVVDTVIPADLAGFVTLQREGITLYLQKDIEVLPEGVSIGLNQLLWVKKLDIHGLDILP